MKSKKKWVWIILPILIFGILSIGIVSLTSLGMLKTQQTALPDNLQLTRTKFPNIETISTQTTGEGIIPDSVNLQNIYQIELILSGCGQEGDLIVNNIKRRSYAFHSCEGLYYEEGGIEFQHYETRKLTFDVDGLPANKLTFEISEKLEGGIITDSTLNVWELVDCTRSSQCPIISINGERVQSFCDFKHTCTINTDDPRIEESAQTTDERETIPITPALFWISTGITIIIISVGLYFFVRWLMRK